MTPEERAERAERRLKYAEQKIETLENQVGGLLGERERVRAAARRERQSAYLVRHAAIQQLAVIDSYRGQDHESRRAERQLTGQEA